MDIKEIEQRLAASRAYITEGWTREDGKPADAGKLTVHFGFDCKELSNDDIDSIKNYLVDKLNVPYVSVSTNSHRDTGQTYHQLSFPTDMGQLPHVQKLFGDRDLPVSARFPGLKERMELRQKYSPILPEAACGVSGIDAIEQQRIPDMRGKSGHQLG